MIIPSNEIARGVSRCQDNVDRFLIDAYLLDKNGSSGHALALVILAMEEYAKKLLLTAYAISPVTSSETLNDAFIKHQYKLEWVVSEVIKVMPDTPKNEQHFRRAVGSLAKTLLRLKNTCLYVDYTDETGWIEPNRPETQGGAQYQTHVLTSLMKKIEPWLNDARLVKFFT